MTDDKTHTELLSISPGYREFYAEQVRDHAEMMPWDDDPDPHYMVYMVREFAAWLVVPGMAKDYTSWTAEEFRLEMEHWES